MDIKSIEAELDKRGVTLPPLDNQNTDETLILDEIKKRKGFDWMSEEEVIETGKKLLKPVIEPFKEYAAEELEKGRSNWEDEMGKIDPKEMGQIEEYLTSPEFKINALPTENPVVGCIFKNSTLFLKSVSLRYIAISWILSK